MMEYFSVNIKLKLIVTISIHIYIYATFFFLILNNNIQLIDSNVFGQQCALVTTDWGF